MFRVCATSPQPTCPSIRLGSDIDQFVQAECHVNRNDEGNEEEWDVAGQQQELLF